MLYIPHMLCMYIPHKLLHKLVGNYSLLAHRKKDSLFTPYALSWNKKPVPGRVWSDSAPESAPEYEFGSFTALFDCDSGSGSFQVWIRFQTGIGSTARAGTKWSPFELNFLQFRLHLPLLLPHREKDGKIFQSLG